MKALSIRQPWAWAIICAGKDIENRSWKTGYVGPLLIHAAKEMTLREYAEFCEYARKVGISYIPPPSAFARGGIVGRAELMYCCTVSRSPWFTGPYGLALRNSEPLPFRPLRGRLGLFDVEEECQSR